MKKFVLATLIVCLSATTLLAAQEAKQCKTQKWLDNMAYNYGRGVVNCLTFWVEVPRNLLYENLRNPFFGTITGLSDGGFLGVARAFGGATDVLTFGLTGPGIYDNSFPEYVWQSKWIADDALLAQEIARENKKDAEAEEVVEVDEVEIVEIVE